jgi:hypothetical protein
MTYFSFSLDVISADLRLEELKIVRQYAPAGRGSSVRISTVA